MSEMNVVARSSVRRLAGSALGIGAMLAIFSAGHGVSPPRNVPSVDAVTVRHSTLDLSRLMPQQFADWETTTTR